MWIIFFCCCCCWCGICCVYLVVFWFWNLFLLRILVFLVRGVVYCWIRNWKVWLVYIFCVCVFVFFCCFCCWVFLVGCCVVWRGLVWFCGGGVFLVVFWRCFRCCWVVWNIYGGYWVCVVVLLVVRIVIFLILCLCWSVKNWDIWWFCWYWVYVCRYRVGYRFGLWCDWYFSGCLFCWNGWWNVVWVGWVCCFLCWSFLKF